MLQERLQRQTPSADAKDASENEMDLAPLLTYEVALRDACRKVVDTAASLQSDLDRLDNELRGRLWAHSQSRIWHRTRSGSQHRRWSRGQSRVQSESRHRAQSGNPHWGPSQGGSGYRAGAQSLDHHQVDSQNE